MNNLTNPTFAKSGFEASPSQQGRKRLGRTVTGYFAKKSPNLAKMAQAWGEHAAA